MFNLSPIELAIVAIWGMGIVVAVALILTKPLGLRARIIVLLAAIGLPLVGSLPVMAYGIYSAATSRRKQQLRS